MSDLISRGAVMEMLTNIELSYTVIPITEAKLQLRELPTVEAKPVVKGKWIFVQDMIPYYRCSNCSATNDYALAKFCPNCGADMRGGKNG